jgi:hypothetical protein
MLVQPKKYGRYIALAIAVVFIYKNPVEAAHIAKWAGTVISGGANSLTRFTQAFK